ncbi:NADPH-dependent F420 reductase [Oenococcus sicerae]|uniref:NADPH-dependent F420 reductase n=1 Tax=Oenococcus sicerae TaxID=2203724 RepID=A0ABX5QMY2_9LACO|nr:NADPH-dependent F420 reductase [Oenococcus sicerae]QAS70142.1 NADPH-dependent F420 reductase [Oenococcus sicerae]
MKISIFGHGNMGKAIGENFTKAGNEVEFIGHDSAADAFGEIVILAVPYSSITDIIGKYADKLANKLVVDITNPVDFASFDSLVVPADSSAAAEIAAKLPNSIIAKAFNTNFAATLTSKKVANKETTTVLIASDDNDAKTKFISALSGSGLKVINAGGLKRARELEAAGFLAMTLAASEQIGWDGGLTVL